MIRELNALAIGVAMTAAGAASAVADDSPLTSGHISAAIAAGLPKFAQKPDRGDASEALQEPLRKGPSLDPAITTLPAYTVREAKIPTEERVLTYGGRAKLAMNTYLGPADGLDRGVLNRYTLAQLWTKIPILGRLPFVGTAARMSSEDRGFDAGGANDTLPYPHPPPKERD